MSRQDIDAFSKNFSETQKLIEHLSKIIDTQTLLAQADFNLNAFMDLVVVQMQTLTPANGNCSSLK